MCTGLLAKLEFGIAYLRHAFENTFVTRLAYLRHAFFDTDFSPTATAFGGGGNLGIVPGGTNILGFSLYFV